MVHGMHLPWVACSNDLERAFVTLWSKFKIHTEDTHKVHFSLSIWKVPASNVKRWSEEEKAISLKGMSWCAEIPVVDPTHHCCSCCCCTDIDFNQNFPKVPFKSSKENHSNYINFRLSVCWLYKFGESLSFGLVFLHCQNHLSDFLFDDIRLDLPIECGLKTLLQVWSLGAICSSWHTCTHICAIV